MLFFYSRALIWISLFARTSALAEHLIGIALEGVGRPEGKREPQNELKELNHA